ncbi:MAG: tail fiber protein [Azospirillaceae bacterium]|nr:tail fiber protein [Azospirillaceae bacterium]
MVEAYLGEIRIWPCPRIPEGWAVCDGSMLPVADNQPLFDLIGTSYGGDGRNNFALPDLRCRIPVNMGQGQGLSNRALASTGGSSVVELTEATLPSHRHGLRVSTAAGTTNQLGESMVVCKPSANFGFFSPTPTGKRTQVSGNDIIEGGDTSVPSTVGGNLPHDNRMPYLILNYIICLRGLFPDRPTS